MGFKTPEQTSQIVADISAKKCYSSTGKLIILSFLAGAYMEPFKSTAIMIAYAKAYGGADLYFHGHILHTLTFIQAFIKGIGCNWLISLGIFMATSANDLTSKAVSIWLSLFSFCALGFEHAVANMYLVPIGMLLGANINLIQFITNNLIPVTLGNVVGGAIFVGCAYGFLYLKKGI
jgi:formate/nitrite transporter FocA (FNT family)